MFPKGKEEAINTGMNSSSFGMQLRSGLSHLVCGFAMVTQISWGRSTYAQEAEPCRRVEVQIWKVLTISV